MLLKTQNELHSIPIQMPKNSTPASRPWSNLKSFYFHGYCRRKSHS
jgi:hypothetical protein